MDIQQLATLLAPYRARRTRLRRVDTSGMTPLERYRYDHNLGGVDAVITLAEQLLERRRARTQGASPHGQEQQPVIAAQAPVETRPFFRVDDTECYLPEVDEALLAAFEEGRER